MNTSKVKSILLVILGIYSLGLTITHCNRKSIGSHFSEASGSTPDTVYRFIPKPVRLDQEVKPSTVTLPPNPKLFSGTEVPSPPDSVAAVEINQESLSFIFQDKQLNLSQYDFKINLDKYQYLWVDGTLTQKKKSILQRTTIKPYIEIGYGCFNGMVDVEGGLKVKFGNLNTTLGIQGYRYPQFSKDPGWDLKIRIQYEF